MEKKFDIMYYVRIGGVLFLICTLTALLLAVVNNFTADKIELNSAARRNDSIALIFGDGITATEVKQENADPVQAVYEVFDVNGIKLGYAVHSKPVGFKGDIEMMVGITLAGHCKSVEIISMSETPGLGTKVGESSFLGQYNNKTGNLVLDEDIQPCAGATISSRTVNDAVNASFEAVGGLIG